MNTGLWFLFSIIGILLACGLVAWGLAKAAAAGDRVMDEAIDAERFERLVIQAADKAHDWNFDSVGEACRKCGLSMEEGIDQPCTGADGPEDAFLGVPIKEREDERVEFRPVRLYYALTTTNVSTDEKSYGIYYHSFWNGSPHYGFGSGDGYQGHYGDETLVLAKQRAVRMTCEHLMGLLATEEGIRQVGMVDDARWFAQHHMNMTVSRTVPPQKDDAGLRGHLEDQDIYQMEDKRDDLPW